MGHSRRYSSSHRMVLDVRDLDSDSDYTINDLKTINVYSIRLNCI